MLYDSDLSQADELKWLALRYIAGEMTGPETSEFEQRLAVDQAACDAVAGSVQATLTIQAAFESTGLSAGDRPAGQVEIPSDRAPWPQAVTPARHIRWLSVATTAATVIVVLFTVGVRARRADIPVSQPDRSRELAVVWVETGEVFREIPAREVPAAHNDGQILSADVPEDQVPPVDLEDVPEWLLVALQTQRGQAGDVDNVLEN
jgi:hypothetical protein